jgi:energy-coupling factor transporter transmembrane protein EcfT
MDSRGFGAVPEHTNYARSDFRWTDGVFTIICLVLGVLVLFVV